MVAEDHYPHIEQLTAKHRQKIAELRSRLADDLEQYPEYDTDFSMLRWLLGWDYDIEKIVPKAKWAISVFKNLGLDKFQIEDTEDLNKLLKERSEAIEYFPGGLMGQDAEGNVIYMQPMARTHPKSIIKADSISKLFVVQVVETECAFKLVRAAEKRTGRKLGVKIVMDLEGFSMDLLYMPGVKAYMNLLTLLQAVFPDFARRILIINPPMMMSTVFNMFKPVLSKQTVEKVAFVGSNWRDVMVEELGAENVFPHWGGSRRADIATGSIRMGGRCPEKMFYDPSSNLFDEDRSFKKVNVPARGKTEVPFTAKEGQTIRWLFRISSGDLDFAIRFGGKEVYPMFRVMSEFVPEMGQIEAPYTGEYSLLFDNSHGKVWSKDVKYRVGVQ